METGPHTVLDPAFVKKPPEHSVRVVIEGLLLAGIVWLASSVQIQGKSIVRLETQMEGMRLEMQQLSGQLANVPELARQQARIQERIGEHERRIERLESLHAHELPAMKPRSKGDDP